MPSFPSTHKCCIKHKKKTVVVILRSKTNQMCQKRQAEVKCKLVVKPSAMILLICRKQDAVSDGRGLTPEA